MLIFLKNLRIRYKLLISYSLVIIFSLSLGSAHIYTFVRKSIAEKVENELNNSTETILNMVKTSAAVSIKNYLRAVAEKNRDITDHYYQRYLTGEMSEKTAKKRAAALLLSQTIGTSGYIYCMDSRGTVWVHPQKELDRVNVSGHEFVRRQMERKEGYLEYQWKNPGENQPRPKALYMTYFAPWDWIISATTYRSEFKELVNVEDFQKSVLALHFGATGYSFVIDKQGKALIHPKLQGINILDDERLPNEYLEHMQSVKKGKIVYPWKNPGESAARQKLVIFNYIPEYDWIVASSSYLDEFYSPLTTIRRLVFMTVLASLLLVLPIAFKISTSITDPLKKLMQQLGPIKASSFSSRVVQDSHDEIGILFGHFNTFMSQLEIYDKDLNQQINDRRKAEEALQESEERYRSVMEAAPDPMVVYDMGGHVTYLNPAFTRVFGWTPAQCIGRKMDHFVVEENWPETRELIKKALDGEILPGTETQRYTQSGRIVQVSVSGATFKDRDDKPAGTIVILRDITQAKQLERQVMDTGDRERQRIGQDLHDDLCPHLIGVQGLTTVLKENLEETAGADAALAGKIVFLIQDAIEKARRLARGLCPVHLVSHGIHAALADLSLNTQTISGLPCRFSADPAAVLTDNTVATHFYHIAREAVNNAIRHAGSSRIDIALTQEGNTCHLRISDDGKGISQTAESRGIGLKIMAYRAKMIGASFDIETGRDSGTVIHVYKKLKLRKTREANGDDGKT